MSWVVREGDVLARLGEMPDGSVQTAITSPPYWGLRDYGQDGQLGLEESPDLYVANMVAVFREVRRVLRDDGTLWLNLGDSYASGGMSNPSESSTLGGGKDRGAADYSLSREVPSGLKPKDLVGIPWRVAFALQADGWYLRSDIIWAKPNPMPESVTDRPTKAHEYLFLLTKSARYFYDADAVREEASEKTVHTYSQPDKAVRAGITNNGTGASTLRVASMGADGESLGRNKRTVWTVATAPFKGAHFAVFPPKLIEPCVLAGSKPGDTVLDPFSGSGTTGMVALRHDRSYVGIELNPEYAAMSRDRIRDDAPLLNTGLEVAA